MMFPVLRELLYGDTDMHHTKYKGDLGVLKAQVDLFEQGFTILSPMTEHAPLNATV